jgi:chromosomal replication initiator protein
MSVEEISLPKPRPESSPAGLWVECLRVIQSELSEQSFKTWFVHTKLRKIESDVLYLEVPDPFFGDWLRDHYHEIIREAVFQISGKRPEIKYLAVPLTQATRPIPFKTPPNQSVGSNPSLLNNRYTFDHFVVGPGNRFAHAAAIAITEAPARNYNPLFLYGRVGLGKTHLMQAVAHTVLSRELDARIMYISGEKFTTQLISAIQTKSTPSFRSRFRTADILLVDDIHFIAGKESTQEEFFHTFNSLYDAHKQIIVSSDRPPKEIPGLEERLISRFAWGLVADLQPPDFETRVAILKKKMERETVVVPDDVVYFIASKIKSNIRELEGALIRVVAYSQLTGTVVDMRTVEGEILRDALKEEVGNVSIDRIQKSVCDYFKLKVSDLRAKNRSKSIAYPRQIAMYLVRSMTDHSLPEIGAYFGGRGHATVIHACNKIERLLVINGKLQQVVEDVKLLINKA